MHQAEYYVAAQDLHDAKNRLTQWFKPLESPRDAKWMFKDNCVVAPGV